MQTSAQHCASEAEHIQAEDTQCTEVSTGHRKQEQSMQDRASIIRTVGCYRQVCSCGLIVHQLSLRRSLSQATLGNLRQKLDML